MVFIQDRRPEGLQMMNSALAQIQQRAADEQQARRLYLSTLMQGQPFERRVALMQGNRGTGINIPPEAMQKSPEEQFRDLVTRQNMGLQEGFHPDPFQSEIIATENLTGRNPNAEYTNMTAQRAYLPPDQFAAAQQVAAKITPDANTIYGQTGPEAQGRTYKDVQQGNQAAADTAFTTGPKTKLTGAQTVEAGAGASEKSARAKLIGKQTDMLNTSGINPDTGQLDPSLQRKVDLLVKREASLDTVTKGTKNPNERAILLASMPAGVKPAMNDKELETVRSAESKADLIGQRIDKIAQLSDVVDNPKNRAIIAYTLNQAQGGAGALFQSALKNIADPRVREYVYELQQSREEIIGYRQFFGNSPVRSDKQVALITGQLPDATMGSSEDVKQKLKSFAPVSAMIRNMYGLGGVSGSTSTQVGQQGGGGDRIVTDPNEVLSLFQKKPSTSNFVPPQSASPPQPPK